MGVFVEGTDDNPEDDVSWTTLAEFGTKLDARSVTMAELAGLLTGLLLFRSLFAGTAHIPSPCTLDACVHQLNALGA